MKRMKALLLLCCGISILLENPDLPIMMAVMIIQGIKNKSNDNKVNKCSFFRMASIARLRMSCWNGAVRLFAIECV
jgi:hypothetical protein